jgi:hypothetical protein
MLKLLLVKNDHNIGFREKRQFFAPKKAKIADNCDQNIKNKEWFTGKNETGCIGRFFDLVDRRSRSRRS